MKTLLALTSLVLITAGSAVAGEGQVADQTLAKMGLGGMQVMTDADGMNVRGMAFVKVTGWSAAHNRNAETYNDYVAVGHKSANGSSYSKVYKISNHGFKVSGAVGGAQANAR
jgi:hypothetical protein